MKLFSLITTYLLVFVYAVSQVYAVLTEAIEKAEGVTLLARAEQSHSAHTSCIPILNMEQAHRSLIMAVCEQMQPGFMRNMMDPITTSNVLQNLGRRDVNPCPKELFAYYDAYGRVEGCRKQPRYSYSPECEKGYKIPVPCNPQQTACAC